MYWIRTLPNAGQLLQEENPHRDSGQDMAGALDMACSMLVERNPMAFFMIGATGEVLAANPAASALLAEGDGFVFREGCLRLVHRADDERLQGLVRALSVPAGAPAMATTPALLGVSRPSGRSAYAVLVSPLATSRRESRRDGAVGCILVADPEHQTRMPTEALCGLFTLTPSEGRLAARLTAGESLRAAAGGLGITYGTARTMLGGIFRKTGTRRQVELVRLLAGLAPLATLARGS